MIWGGGLRPPPINHGGGAASGHPPRLFMVSQSSTQITPQMGPTTAPQTAPQTAAQTARRQPQDSPLNPQVLKPHLSCLHCVLCVCCVWPRRRNGAVIWNGVPISRSLRVRALPLWLVVVRVRTEAVALAGLLVTLQDDHPVNKMICRAFHGFGLIWCSYLGRLCKDVA